MVKDFFIVIGAYLSVVLFLILSNYVSRVMIDRKPYRWIVFIAYALTISLVFISVLSWLNKY